MGDYVQSPMAPDFTDHAYMMKPPSKPKYGIKQLLGWGTQVLGGRCWEDCMPREGIKALHPFLHTLPCTSPLSGCS